MRKGEGEGKGGGFLLRRIGRARPFQGPFRGCLAESGRGYCARTPKRRRCFYRPNAKALVRGLFPHHQFS